MKTSCDILGSHVLKIPLGLDWDVDLIDDYIKYALCLFCIFCFILVTKMKYFLGNDSKYNIMIEKFKLSN